MWQDIWETAMQNGLWAMMFIALFYIQIKDSRAREDKYLQTIDSLAAKLDIINEINDKVDEIIIAIERKC